MSPKIIKNIPDLSNDKLPALVFVHGAWHGAWCWEENFLPYFSKNGFDCYAFDLPNHGLSKAQKGINKHRIKDYVHCLQLVLNKIDKPIILIGHSMGGLVVQKYLEENECEAAILLMSVPSKPIWRILFKMTKTFPLSMLRAFLGFNLIHLVNTPEKTRKFFFSPNLSEELNRKYMNLMSSESMSVVLYDFLGTKLKARKNQSFPLLVQCAENDEIVSLEENIQTAKKQNGDFQLLKNIAHDLMLEPNWKLSASNILYWLKEKVPSIQLEQLKENTPQKNPSQNIEFPNAVPNLITNLGKKISIDAGKTKISGLEQSKRDN